MTLHFFFFKANNFCTFSDQSHSVKMKGLLVIVCVFVFQSPTLIAQNIDSLKRDIVSNNDDTSKVFTFLRLCNHYLDHERDSAMQYAQDALNLAISTNFIKGEAQSLNFIGSILNSIGNYPKALEFHLNALKKAEDLKNERLIYSTYNNIARVSTERTDYRAALEYYFKAQNGFKSIDDKFFLTTALTNIGDTYDRMNQFDSAFFYLNAAQDLARQHDDTYNLAVITSNLGHMFITANKINEAYNYFQEALDILENDPENNDKETLAGAYEGLSKVFEKKKKLDSALIYALRSYQISMKIADQKRILNAAKRLTELYEGKNTDSAYCYSKVANETREAILNEQKIAQMESLKFNEQLRQQELTRQLQKQIKERKNNLRLIGIVLSIITFFAILIIFSRRKAHPKALKYLGMLGTLFLFEFLALFIHPYIDKLTGHDPVYMLIILVGVAAILVPLHHKMEHWVKEKLAKGTIKVSPGTHTNEQLPLPAIVEHKKDSEQSR